MLTESQQEVIINTRHYVQEKLANDRSGHDIAHIDRVVKLALHIQQTETDTDAFIIAMSAYLHDVIDDKVAANSQLARQELIDFLHQQHITSPQQQAILAIIENMSFSKNLVQKKELSQEGMIVQDADRLDALGAIGIARAFYYGGNKQHIMHDMNIAPRTNLTEVDYRKPNTIINHFYEKLFLLKDQMNTEEGKKLAMQRHQFLVTFIRQFEDEWNSQFDD